MRREKLVWYAPKWSTNSKQWWVIRKYLLSPGPIFRIIIASLIAVAVVLTAFKIAFPAIVFPNLFPLVFVMPALVAGFCLQTYVLSFLKERVMVTSKKIVVSHGESATIIKLGWLTKVILAIHDDERARIRFCYDQGGKSKFKTVGLSNEVDMNILENFLPMDIIPRDYRRSLKHEPSTSSMAF